MAARAITPSRDDLNPFRLFMIPRIAESMPAIGVRQNGHPLHG